MTEAHPGYMDAADVVRIHRVTIAYVYKLANRDRWRRYTMDGRVRYHRADVDKTLGRNPSLSAETPGKISP